MSRGHRLVRTETFCGCRVRSRVRVLLLGSRVELERHMSEMKRTRLGSFGIRVRVRTGLQESALSAQRFLSFISSSSFLPSFCSLSSSFIHPAFLLPLLLSALGCGSPVTWSIVFVLGYTSCPPLRLRLRRASTHGLVTVLSCGSRTYILTFGTHAAQRLRWVVLVKFSFPPPSTPSSTSSRLLLSSFPPLRASRKFAHVTPHSTTLTHLWYVSLQRRSPSHFHAQI
jgi:hypothetical protein